MSTQTHTDFSQTLSAPTTSSKEKKSESIVEFLPYSNINVVPETIKKTLYDQGLPSDEDLSKYPIICGYLKDQNTPFIASIKPPYELGSTNNITLKYYTPSGNYCYEPWCDTKKLTFEHLIRHKSKKSISKKSQTTSNGVLNETIDNPFSNDPNYLQECAGNISTLEDLCIHSSLLAYYNFFRNPIKYYTVGHEFNIDALISNSTPEYPTALTKVFNIALRCPSNDTQAYLISIAKANQTSKQRFSYLYESQEAYKNGEKPLMIYTCLSPDKSSFPENKDNSYILTNSGNYINFGQIIVSKDRNYYQILSYDKVVEGFPTDLSEDTQNLIANPFPPELAIIYTEATKRYKESLQSKSKTSITQKIQ